MRGFKFLYLIYSLCGMFMLGTAKRTVSLVDPNGIIMNWDTYGSESNIDLEWNLDLPTLMNLTLTVNKLWLVETKMCQEDKLRVMHHNNLENSIVFDPLCHKISENNTFTYSFLDYGFRLLFKVGMSVNGTYGFTLTYASFRPETQQICDKMHNAGKKIIGTQILGSKYVYPLVLNCSWYIQSSENFLLGVVVEKFDIEFSGNECIHDHLEIWETFRKDPITSYSRLGRFCGRHHNWTMIVYSHNARIVFVSDRVANQGGFLIRYSDHVESCSREIHLQPLRVTPDSINMTFPPGGISWTPGQSIMVIWHIRTHPGFYIRVDFNETINDETFRIHDGPDGTSPVMDTYGKKIIKSTGFHLVFRKNISKQTELIWKLKFKAISAFSQERTTVRHISEIYDSNVQIRRANADQCCGYAKAISPPFKTLRILYMFDSEEFAERPNTDDCEYSGIAFFDGEVSFDKIIGPFCDVIPGFTKTLVQNFISSSSVIYVAEYDYTFQGTILVDIMFLVSSCRGYHVTKPIIETFAIGSKTYSLKIYRQNNTVVVSPRYVQGEDECVILYLLPRATKDISRLQIRPLSKNIQYRTCRQFGREYGRDSGVYPVSKYRLKETCGDTRHDLRETYFEEDIGEKEIWTTDYIRVEFETVDADLCGTINSCPDQGGAVNLTIPCGVIIYMTAPVCYWVLAVPRDVDYVEQQWFFKVPFLFFRLFPPYGFLEIEEFSVPSGQWGLRTQVHLNKTSFTYGTRNLQYRTVDAGTLIIRPKEVQLIDLRFQMVAKESYTLTKAGVNNDCYIFGGHCYTFVPINHSNASWNDALDHCGSKGGYMVSINTVSELQFIKQSLASVWKEEFFGQNHGKIFIGLSDIETPGEYIWEDGSPVSVSDWYYPFDTFNNILTVDPRPDLDVEQIQPVYNRTLRCVSMNIGNPFLSTNWAKLGCGVKQPIPSNVICEAEMTLPRETFDDEIITDQSVDVGYKCADGWNFVRNSCFATLTADIKLNWSIGDQEAKEMCESHEGEIAVIGRLSIDELRNYLQSLGFMVGDGDIWVKFNSNQIGCISLTWLEESERKSQHNMANSTEACISMERKIRHVICERQALKKALICPSHLFRCHDGTCLSPVSICDRRIDCANGEDENNCTRPHDAYVCGDEQIISINKYCDFHQDCLDGSDENKCVHPVCSESQFRCTNGQCVSGTKRCDHKSDCIDHSDEGSCDWGLSCQGFKCPVVGCLPHGKFRDIQPDCPDASQADEDHKNTYHKRYMHYSKPQWNTESFCPGHTDHQRCHYQHAKCFPRHKSCIYDHDHYGQLRYCRNGAHLRHCEFFECPNMFKCPMSYCVPHNKVCDGIRDCIDGADESNCTRKYCPGLFRCGDSAQCTSLEDLCDGRPNCRFNWTDELFCALKTFVCPQNCTCRGYTLSCHGIYHLPYIEISAHIRVFDLDRNQLHLNSSLFYDYPYLAVMILSNNQLDNIPLYLFENLSNLVHLDLTYNMLTTLSPGTFNRLGNLLTLTLEGNPLSLVEKETFLGLSSLPRLNLSGLLINDLGDDVFYGLTRLKVLDLSNNRISSINLGAFASLPILDLLLLEMNPLDNTDVEIFRSLHVENMRTDSYRFCCFVGKNVTYCKPDKDVYSSCSDLLANEFIQVVVWMFGIFAAVGNISVICWHLSIKLKNSPSVFILHLSISDTLMAVYLICLASTDTVYRGTYILHDEAWRESSLCHFIGAIATLSCEMSIFTLFCIAVDRTKRLVYAFEMRQFTAKTAWFTMALGWVCSLAIAGLPFVVPSYFGNYYGRNAICLPFNFAEPSGEGWEFATVVFIGLNTITLLLIFVMYAKIYCNVKETQTRAGRQDRSDLEVARRLSMIILTNVVCFIPIIITNTAAVLGQPVNRDIASFLTTVVLPVNAALNPFLFTFSTCRSKTFSRTPKT